MFFGCGVTMSKARDNWSAQLKIDFGPGYRVYDTQRVAKDAGLRRASLYRALSADGNPSFAAVIKVARALGVRLHAQAA